MIDGQHVQLFKTMWDQKKKFTLSLFSSRGMQQTDGLMHCIENFACLHHLHGTIRSLYVSVYLVALGDVQQATDRSQILRSMRQ